MILGSDHYWRDWSIQNPDKTYSYCGIDFARAFANGSRFTILKACDGLYPTRFFHNAYNDAVNAGFLTGAYAWLDSSQLASINGQADFWYSELKDVGLISIDFESFEDNVPSAPDLWGAATRLRQNGHKGKLGVYTNWSYWLEHGSGFSTWLTLFDFLWLADPDSLPQPPSWAPPSEFGRKAPAPFSDYQFHQFSWTGSPPFYGIRNTKSAVDENWFNGTLEELEQLFGGVVTPPPPPTGEPMKYTFVCQNAPYSKLNIWSDHNSLSTDIGDLLNGESVGGDILETLPNGEKWLKVMEKNGLPFTTQPAWVVVFMGTWRGTLAENIPPTGQLPVIQIHQLFTSAGYPDKIIDEQWSPNA